MARLSDYGSDLFKEFFFNVSFLAVYHSTLTLQVIHDVSYILGLIHHVIFNLPSVSHLSFERIVQGWNRKYVLWNHKGHVFKGAAYLKHSSDNYPEGMPHVFRFSGIIMARRCIRKPL
jgi:hypothetical protein